MFSKDLSRTIFKVFGMTRPGIEPRSPGPLANTLPIGPVIRFRLDVVLTYIQQTCHLVNFAVPADHRVKIKEREKIEKYLDLA